MAGLQDVDVVDLVAEDADGTVLLVLIETRPWDEASEEQERQLWMKLDNYAGYVQSGQLHSDSPDFVGKPIAFSLECSEEPSSKYLGILGTVAGRLAEKGIDVYYNVNPELAQ